jgi:hypothetical protein
LAHALARDSQPDTDFFQGLRVWRAKTRSRLHIPGFRSADRIYDLEGFANANAPVSFTFNAGMDQPRAVDGDEIEGELLSEVDS